MLSPKRVKFRKMFKGRTTGAGAPRRTKWPSGTYGLQALEPGWVTNRQIEAARIAMTRSHQAWRQGVDPDFPGQADHEEAGRNAHG